MTHDIQHANGFEFGIEIHEGTNRYDDWSTAEISEMDVYDRDEAAKWICEQMEVPDDLQDRVAAALARHHGHTSFAILSDSAKAYYMGIARGLFESINLEWVL